MMVTLAQQLLRLGFCHAMSSHDLVSGKSASSDSGTHSILLTLVVLMTTQDKGGGVFCGPLRLLALEIYDKLNSEGLYTNLYTGQEHKQVSE